MPKSNSLNQKWVHCTAIRSFCSHPTAIRSINHNIKIFKAALKLCLLSHHSYCVDEFTLIENFYAT